MSLRLRLIVVFFLLSVVPVGAITFYTYANNAQAIREAAGSEAAALAQDLSQRMRSVTTQLSQRVETLVELPPAPAIQAAAVARPAPPAPPAAALEPPAPTPASEPDPDFELKLGDFAEMIKNVEIRGMRGGGRRFGPDGRPLGRPEGGAMVVVIPPNRVGTPLPAPTPPGVASVPPPIAPADPAERHGLCTLRPARGTGDGAR